MKQIYFTSGNGWQKWLENNYETENEIWLTFYKKHTQKESIEYEDAVNIALCFGWIDSIIKRIDNESYVRKFTKRNDKSNWSEINKKRTERLIKSGQMRNAGLKKIEIARENGNWDKKDRPDFDFTISINFKIALDNNLKAGKYFESLSNTYKKQYITWIAMAKRTETKEKRLKDSVLLLERGKKLGLK